MSPGSGGRGHSSGGPSLLRARGHHWWEDNPSGKAASGGSEAAAALSLATHMTNTLAARGWKTAAQPGRQQ